jgi:hypothetical protein
MAKKKKGSQSKKQEEKEFELPEGLELLEGNGWGSRIINWLKNNFSAIILPIIALIILGGGIYLYSQQQDNNLDIQQEDLESGITIDLEEDEEAIEEETTEEDVTEEETEEETTEIAVNDEETTSNEIIEDQSHVTITEETSQGGPISQQGKEFKETAKDGEGITHLARKALSDYLKDKDLKLSAEHKIYIEDYLQNRTGTHGLTLGEEVSFGEDLIQEAVSASQKLTDQQLENLKQYSNLVPSLS